MAFAKETGGGGGTARLLSDSVQVFLTRVVRLVVAFGAGILLARWLQPEGRGAYAILVQYALFACAIGGMSINYATIHYAGKKVYGLREQGSNGLVAALIFGVATSLVSLGLLWAFSEYFRFSTAVVVLLVVLIPLQMLDSNWRALLHAQSLFRRLNSLELVNSITFLAILILLVTSFAPSLERAALAWGGGICVSFAVLLVMVRKQVSFRPRFERTLFRDHLHFGLKAHLSTVIGLLSLRLDQFMLRYFTSDAEVGVYAVAVTLAELLWFIPSSVSFVLLPKAAAECRHQVAADITRACKWIALISAVCALVLALLASPLISYGYGVSYAAALPALWLLLPGMVAVSVTTVTTPYFLGQAGKPQLGALVAAVSLVTNILFNLLLIPTWGSQGCAVASTLSYVCATIVNLYLFQRLVRTS